MARVDIGAECAFKRRIERLGYRVTLEPTAKAA